MHVFSVFAAGIAPPIARIGLHVPTEVSCTNPSVTEAIMLRSTGLRKMLKLSALAALLTLSLGSLAWAHDYDDYNRGEVRQRAYQTGQRDGFDHGRYDRSAGYRYNIHSQQYNDARDGYEYWMGSFGHYKKAYREGYAYGYGEGYNSRRRGWDHDRDRDDYYRRHDRDDYR
jgi:uncharacterized protein YkwD